MAIMTFVRLVLETRPVSFTTRETVAVETPASLATSLTVHGRTFPSVLAITISDVCPYLTGEAAGTPC
jgi:hypothetical protein